MSTAYRYRCKWHSIHQEGKYEKLRFGKMRRKHKMAMTKVSAVHSLIAFSSLFIRYVFLADKRELETVCLQQSVVGMMHSDFWVWADNDLLRWRAAGAKLTENYYYFSSSQMLGSLSLFLFFSLSLSLHTLTHTHEMKCDNRMQKQRITLTYCISTSTHTNKKNIPDS